MDYIYHHPSKNKNCKTLKILIHLKIIKHVKINGIFLYFSKTKQKNFSKEFLHIFLNVWLNERKLDPHTCFSIQNENIYSLDWSL